MKSVRKRFTYANVMSSIAVFLVVAGGSAFAASQLGKNTVGSKQLKKEAVTNAKIKKGTIEGSKIKLSTVGKVPSAATADTAGTATSAKTAESANSAKTADTATSAKTAEVANVANALGPAEPVHIVGTAGQPAFEDGSHNYSPPGIGSILNLVGFWKDREGVVHLQGIAEGGKPGTGIASIFTLPPGFRPADGKLLLFEPINEAEAIIAGNNTFLEGKNLSAKVIGGEEKPVPLDGITFRAEG
jgi:hypothetical protein